LVTDHLTKLVTALNAEQPKSEELQEEKDFRLIIKTIYPLLSKTITTIENASPINRERIYGTLNIHAGVNADWDHVLRRLKNVCEHINPRYRKSRKSRPPNTFRLCALYNIRVLFQEVYGKYTSYTVSADLMDFYSQCFDIIGLNVRGLEYAAARELKESSYWESVPYSTGLVGP
jgi:hypothetical protein